jgi:precorrin-6B methylase 1
MKKLLQELSDKRPDIDFQTATEVNLHGLPDEEVLAYAAQETRILVTHDRRTMPAHFANFIVNQTSPGAFIISGCVPPVLHAFDSQYR